MAADIALLIDFGSTYTKVTAIDLESEELVGRTQSPTTVATDIMVGLRRALDQLDSSTGLKTDQMETRLACSSAAGGLRMAAIGLVPELTAEAAKQAALGAGAKLISVHSYALTSRDVRQLEASAPDLILLAGGTDGGNSDFILRNASALAGSTLRAPIVVAGNRSASDEVEAILKERGKEAILTENVLPGLDRLNVEPARGTIRELFMRRIVHAKGLRGAEGFVGNILMPTPMAVLQAAQLLADGTKEETGLGELLLVDVGGATTDVHSIGDGRPRREGVVLRGIPEPHAKRTVEGDLGIRYNATTIVETVGKEALLRHAELEGSTMTLETAVQARTTSTEMVPEDGAGLALDVGLARAATEVAVRRHAGFLEAAYTPCGRVDIQHGKDLTEIRCLVGTGGIFAWGSAPRRVLEAALYDPQDPLSLRPKNPEIYADGPYILYALGLLANLAPSKALRVAKRHLRPV